MIAVIQNDPIVTAGAWLQPLEAAGSAVRIIPAFSGIPLEDPEALSGAIILGGTMNVDDHDVHPFLLQVRRFMERCLQSGTPLLGICLGGQLLAQILGGEVRANHLGEKGLNPVTLTPQGQKDPLFSGFPPQFEAFQWHNDSFSLPAGSERLASSEVCPNQAFRYEKSWGLQFHPEVDASLVGSWSSRFAPGGPYLEAFKAQEAGYRQRFEHLLNNFTALSFR